MTEFGYFLSMTGVGGRPELLVIGSNSQQGPWEVTGYSQFVLIWKLSFVEIKYNSYPLSLFISSYSNITFCTSLEIFTNLLHLLVSIGAKKKMTCNRPLPEYSDKFVSTWFPFIDSLSPIVLFYRVEHWLFFSRHWRRVHVFAPTVRSPLGQSRGHTGHCSCIMRFRLLWICNKFLVSKETVVLRRWERSKQKFGFINSFDKTKFLFLLWICVSRCHITVVSPETRDAHLLLCAFGSGFGFRQGDTMRQVHNMTGILLCRKTTCKWCLYGFRESLLFPFKTKTNPWALN